MIKIPGKRSPNKRPNEYVGFKTVGVPRDGKKLVIFDMDYTLADPGLCKHDFPGRPYLHRLLGKLYEMYDIGIWSSTTLEDLECQIQILGMDNHPEYKLLFYADVYVSIPIPILGGTNFQVKWLDVVWDTFPEHNPRNTVLCDIKKENSLLYPQNVILISPYFHTLYEEDDELLKVLPYLEYVATLKDVTQTNHKDWTSLIITKTL